MKRKHAAHEEEHENHERWLVTYADMITLLMVLFIVLFAMSSVDQKKFNALKAGLAAGFGQSTSVLDGSESILEEPGTSAAQPIDPRRVEDTPQIAEIKVNAVSQEQQIKDDRQYAEATTEAERLLKIEKHIMKALRKHDLQRDVRTKIDERGLTVSLVSRNVVFQPNVATLTPRGRLIVQTVAPVLRDIPDKLQIEGHTNQAPGAPKYYPTDWDLSTARAVTVLRYLNEVEDVPADRLAAVGYGHVKPLVDPDKPGSQWLNKRVDIVVVSGISDESRRLLGQVLADRGQRVGGTPATQEEKP